MTGGATSGGSPSIGGSGPNLSGGAPSGVGGLSASGGATNAGGQVGSGGHVAGGGLPGVGGQAAAGGSGPSTGGTELNGGAGGSTGQGTCTADIGSGSPCEPAVDTEACNLGDRACTCGADSSLWTCTPAAAGGAGGTAGVGGGAGSGGSETGGQAGGGDSDMEWLPSWATTIQRTEDRNMPPALNDKTLRQFVWPSYSGDEIRIQLSNEKGRSAVEINKVHIAKAQPLGQGSIDASTDAGFTFQGSASVTIPAGETVWSDALSFPLEVAQPTAVSIQFGSSVPSEVTGHPGARTTSYIANGDAVSQANISGETRDRWYFINAIEVMAPADAFAIAALGDSITDGYGVINQFARWPDFLTLAIQEDAELAGKVSVLNFGMGANSLLTPNSDGCNGDVCMDAGVDRVDRDILTRPKVKWVIVLIGVNDIIYGSPTKDQIIGGYREIVQKAHSADIVVYGSPVTPFCGNAPSKNSTREAVNQEVLAGGVFDGIIDFSTVLADPGSSSCLAIASQYDNDGLHPNTAGYEAMGRSVDLSLFE